MPDNLSAGAKDLIENLLVKNPEERMTIEQMRNHEWFNLVDPTASEGIYRK